MPGTALSAGDVAVIGYNNGMHDGTGHPDLIDKLYFVLLKPVVSGTQFFISDRAWNGSTFVNAGGDGTVTYTASGNLAAGTVVEMTVSGGTATFTIAGASAGTASANGFDLETAGDAVYLYQGTDANTPTSFLYASEFADGNTTFNGSLVNTGLSVSAGTAEAISFDAGAYAGPTTYAGSFLQNGAGVTLLQSIADTTNWTGSDQTGQNAIEQHVQSGQWLVAADMDMWGAAVLGGGGIVHVSRDHTVNSGNTSYNTSDLYNNLIVGGTSFFWHLSDMVFDTVAGKFFVVDSDLAGGHNRIMQGNIADLLSNPGTAPTMVTLYSDSSTATDASNRLDNLEVDTTNHIVYFTHAGDLDKVNYNTANQTPTVLFRSDVSGGTSPSGFGNPAGSASNFFNDMVIDFGTGHIYLSSTRVGASSSGDVVVKNYIYDLSGLTNGSGTDAFQFNGSNTGTARLLPFAENDANYDPIPGTSAATHSTPASAQSYFFPKERGTLDGLGLDPVNHVLYFSTGEILFDHDANSGTAPVYVGGVVASYALTSNPTGAITVLFQQPAQSSGAIPGLMGDLEVDTVNGRYYVTDYTGASGTDGTDQHIWSGALGAPGTPTQFTSDLNSIDSLTTVGMTINHAPTIAGTNLNPGITEKADGPPSTTQTGVALFSAVTLDDPDTSTPDEITGAVVRISSGFLSGATHQDLLQIGGNTSGTISGSNIAYTYNSTTGAMVLTGPATVAEYKAAIESVTFAISGDNPTLFGTDASRTIAASVSDGLSMSDEIFATVTVTGLNDNPVNTPGGTASVIEDSTSNAITGVSVFDVDADPATQNLTVTLSVGHGTITLLTNVAGGVIGSQITGGAGAAANATSITITATQNQINATLAAAGGLVYTPTGNYNGADALHIVTSDNSNTGNGGALGDTDDKAISISAVNDAPVVTGGTTQATTTIDEDTPLAAGQSISSLLGSHFDDSIDQQQVAVTNPTGSVANTLAGIAVTANGSAAGTGQWQFSTNGGTTWTNIGAVTDATARLYNAGTLIRFNPTLNYNGAEPTLTVHLIDSSGAAITDNSVANLTGLFGGINRTSSGTVDLGGTINAVNDAPVNTPGATTVLSEDASNVALTGISIADVDAGGGNMTVTLSVQHGTLTINTGVGGGIGSGQITGGSNGSGSITVTATLAQINATLANATGLTYSPTADYNGSDALHIVTSDNGNTGSGGTLTDTDDKTITITAVNDPVTGAAPATLSLAEDSSNVAVTGLSIADVDTVLAPSGVYEVTLSATHGTLTLTTLTGLTFTGGSDGTADASMTFHGTLAAINTALATATFTPTGNYAGSAQITLAATDIFGGVVATGTGASTSDSDSIAVTVTAVNDAPVNSVPGAQTVAEDGTLTLSGVNAPTVSDIDVGAGNLTVTLSVAHGTLSLSGIAGLDFSAGSGGVGDGTNDATMTFSGTAAAINTALNGLVYHPNADYNGADTLTLTTNDNGNTGTPGALQDVDTVAITVTAVADIANDSVSATEDTPASLNLLGNDSFEDPGRTITAVTQGTHGTVTINDNGNGPGSDDFVVYTPNADYNGPDSFTYTVTAGGVTETATVTVTVNAAADIADDNPTTNEDTPVNVMVLGNDTFEATPAITNVGAAGHGTAVLNNNGTAGDTTDDYIVYTPTADYNGSDSFTYTVTSGGVTETATVHVTINAVADIVDDSVTVLQDSGTNNLNLLANDTFESATRFISAVGAAGHGTTAINNNGTPGNTADDFVTYTPAAGYQGPDSFTYTVTSSGLTETATVTVNVGAPDAAPVVDLNTGTAGIDDTNIYQEGGAGSGIGAAIDVSDADVGDMIHGATIAISDPETGDQLFANLPLPGGITIDGSSTDDFLVLTGTASAADYAAALGQIGYRSTSDDPTHGGTHTDRTIGVTVNDGILNSAPATMTMTVFGVDDPAVAQADAVTTDEATVLNGSVFANNGAGADSDPDGPALSVSAVNGSGADVGTQITLTSGAHLTLNANGTFSYDPNHAFDATPAAGSGASNTPASDSFTYTLTGGGTATVSVTVNGLDSNDTLLGTAGADALNAGIGNDHLDGLGGADTMTGGPGNDTYVVDNAGDVVNESPGGGNDTVQTSVSYALAAGSAVETLTVDDVHATTLLDLTGNAFGQTIIGNDGSNGLNGMGGTDLFHGGGGNDFYVVDSADDQVFENVGEGYDIVFATVSYALQGGQEIESLGAYDQASTMALDLTGNEFDNRMVGNAGSNGLNGMGGADQLFGLGGNDFYVVDNAGDQVFELSGDGYDIVFSTVSYTLGTGQEIESLGAYDQSGTAAINLSGNEFDNRIVGNAGDNVLDGSLGSDVLFGLGGADTFAFTTAPSAGNVDFMGDFTTGIDSIALDHNVFSALGVGSLGAGAFVIGSDAQDANTRIIYNNVIGSLLYDPDGTGPAAAIQFATVHPGTVINAADFHVI